MPPKTQTSLARVAPQRSGTGLPALSPDKLAAALEAFLIENPAAVILEEGSVLFHMGQARFTVSVASGRCTLQVWSDQRNVVRTVVGLEVKKEALRLEVMRFGHPKPQSLRILPDADQRTPFAKDTARSRFGALLARMLQRGFPDWKQGEVHAAADLERSFGPAYLRTTLERGQSAWAVVAINGEETQGSVDGILTVGVLWLEACRARAGGKRLFEGLKVIVPAGMGTTTRGRMAWLNAAVAKWELWELDEVHEELAELPPAEDGNLNVQLSRAFQDGAALERCRAGIEQVMDLLPPEAVEGVEQVPVSPTEISLRWHGLEFARVAQGLLEGSFTRVDRVFFGAGPQEMPLTEDTAELFRHLMRKVVECRHPAGSVRNPLFRMQPERWLEGRLRTELAEVEPQLCAEPVYTQTPAMASADRGMLDLLAMTRAGRLAVVEIKAKEDLHMPMQGLDYWMRVRALDRAGEFARNGYFAGKERPATATQAPLLYFVVPSLRLHSEAETLLKYFSPEVEWRLIALDENWRKHLRVIFRKSGGRAGGTRALR